MIPTGDGSAVDEVRYRLLGPMEITVAGTPSKLPGAAERALMVQLLLSPGRTLPATLLVDRLWSESTLPVDPMNALQIRVSKLRRALKAVGVEDVVTREGVGYRAAVDPGQVDALDFAARLRVARSAAAEVDSHEVGHLEAYDDALSLWQGEPLSDFSTEQWATVEAARLNELRLAALTERAQIALGLGRHLEVVGDLEPLVAHDPTLESLAGLLMVALYRSGRQADALEVFTRTRDVLDDALGLEPSVSLRSLHERVLRQDASLGSQPDMATPVPVTAPTGRRASADAQDGADQPADGGAAADRPRRAARLPGGAGRRGAAAVPDRPRRRRQDVARARDGRAHVLRRSPTARSASGSPLWTLPTRSRSPSPTRSAFPSTVPRWTVTSGSGSSPSCPGAACCC